MTRRYIVVYQMGKVASTSIVSTLNELQDISAVQCHFLGEKALAAIVPTITGANVPLYFFKHQLGQFIENIRITRRVNLIRAKLFGDERLVVISLARNPVEWARSGVVQDVEGYLPSFESLCKTKSLPCQTDAEIVTNGLKCVLDESCSLLEKAGGIDAYLAEVENDPAVFKDTIFEDNPGTTRLLRLFLRPANWFEKHFETALGIYIKDMKEDRGVWTTTSPNADYVIVRYEEMPNSLAQWLNKNHVCEIADFKRENISGAKQFSKEVADVFSSVSGDKLSKLYSYTKYSKTFYYGSEQPV